MDQPDAALPDGVRQASAEILGSREKWQMSRRLLFAVVALGGLICLGVGTWAVQRPTPPEQFEPERYLMPQPPVTEVPHKPIHEVADALPPDELVLGVAAFGEARAYPLDLLNEQPGRKVLNDTLGGQPIAATWCDASHNAIVYARDVEGQTLTLAPSGQLWKSNMVMYDVETHSHWSQLLGEAKLGKLEGKQLRRLPGLLTDWQTWKRLYPDSTVACLPYAGEIFRRGAHGNPEKYVLGIADSGQAKAWGLAQLYQTPVSNDRWAGRPVVVVMDRSSLTARLYERGVAGRVLTFGLVNERLTDQETGSTWEMVSGRAVAGPLAGQELVPLPAVVSFQDVWERFYPLSR
jgi:hypothetical protein